MVMQIFAPSGGSSSGSAHDLLDGTQNQDTLAGTVHQGDLIVGNSTPKWARLAVGAANKVIGTDGVDVVWMSYVNGTNISVAVSSGVSFQFNLTNDIKVGGYGIFGSSSAPSNTTAGDLTAKRLLVGTDEAFTSNYDSEFNAVRTYFKGSLTINDSNPAQWFQNVIATSTAATSPRGAQYHYDFQPTDNIAAAICAVYFAKATPASGKTITTLIGIDVESVFIGNNGAVTTSQAILVDTPVATGTLKPGTQVGVQINDQGLSSVTTAIGLRVYLPTNATNKYTIDFQGQANDYSVAVNNGSTAGYLLTSPVACRVRRTTNQSIPNGGALVSYDGEEYDTASIHEGVTNPTRLTAPVSGYYHIGAYVAWTASNTTQGKGIDLNITLSGGGTRVVASKFGPSTGGTIVDTISTDVFMNSGDYYEVTAYQNSGGNVNITSTSQFPPYASEAWMHLIMRS